MNSTQTQIGEEAGNILLEIFQRTCSKPGESLSNKLLHDAYFKKNDSSLGFQEGLKYLVQKRWLEPTEGAANTHHITKSGWRADV
jgi:hypothetical protein